MSSALNGDLDEMHYFRLDGWSSHPLEFELGRDLAMVLLTNIARKNADEALFALAPELYRSFAAPKAR